ncbi:uncharacterized protein IL334_001573 [Kwoniella shivajii]|uniref:G-protein coupled receptors family 1 profile domain-containing protein n=1 Tax=Kwoniella shivajii TaxID=564305 RepID=A0ABZ1CTW8_9TREE|nr:hypothetical protein IL334_001573 [Kwoniella shivajii]
MPLITSEQTRWGMDGLIVILCSVAIGVSAPSLGDNNGVYSPPGGVGGLIVSLGSAGLVGTTVICLLRLLTRLLPKIWNHYLDRLGFTFVALMWICWTSATMSFTLYTIDQSLCQFTPLPNDLPTCPILTFDLTFLHILSIVTFGQVMNYLSIAISTDNTKASKKNNTSGDTEDGEGERDGFIMWELAINSNPPSPVMIPISDLPNTQQQPSSSLGGYGSTSSTNVPTSSERLHQQEISSSESITTPITTLNTTIRIRKPGDKFSSGRLSTYIPLNLCSLGVVCTSFASIRVGEFTLSGIAVFVAAFFGIFLSLGCLITRFAHKRAEEDEEGFRSTKDYARLRKDRILEVGLAGILFLLWPVTAILYTLFPPTPYQPCSNPSASAMPSPGEDYNVDPFPLCQLGWTVITLSWISSWLLLTRIMSLIFPITSMGDISVRAFDKLNPAIHDGREESTSLLNPSTRGGIGNGHHDQGKKKGWERVTAGEEFELGSDEE